MAGKLGDRIRRDWLHAWFPVLLPPLVLVLMWPATLTRLGQQLEDVTVDWRFRARGAEDPAADARLVVVGIEEKGLQQWGRWPWSRQVHAQLLTLLTQRPPAVVGFDLLFTEPSREAGDDQVFGDALVLHPGAITGADAQETLEVQKPYEEEWIGNTQALQHVAGNRGLLVGHDGALLPVPLLAESSFTGFVNAPPDARGMRRKLPLVVRCGERVFPSFVTQVLMQVARAGAEQVEVELGKRLVIRGASRKLEIPIDERGRMAINYRHPGCFTAFPYFDLFSQLYRQQEGQAWPEGYPPIQDQILLIGLTASGLTDLGPTPHAPVSPLMLVHANAINNALQGDYLRQVPAGWLIVGWLALAWGTVVPLRRGPVVLAVLLPLALSAGYIWMAFALFAGRSVELALFWPVAGFALTHGAAIMERLAVETRAKARIKNLFGTYVAPEAVEKMIASGEEPKLGGEEVEITAFFSDIEGFSSFSEMLEPQRLVSLMNDYLTEMNEILQENGGTLDKFIGDAIVGMFGAPLWFPEHAYQACVASVLMQRRQEVLCQKWRRDGNWPRAVGEMRTRIGLNSGVAVIGNIGSRRRFNYTMMGDNVNLAARTESAAKAYGVVTMVTGETRRLALAQREDLVFRYLDKVVVKGRSLPVEMYELVETRSELTAEARDCLATYEEGVARYLARDWSGAERIFQRSAEGEAEGKRNPGGTNPSRVMLERCRELLSNPPGPQWDGVFVMKSK